MKNTSLEKCGIKCPRIFKFQGRRTMILDLHLSKDKKLEIRT